MMINNDLWGALILSALFAAVIGGSEVWARLKAPDPEMTRKAVHILGGLGCLLLPFLIRSPWVVLLMSFGFAGFFYVGQKTSILHCLQKVPRESRGSEYYPLAVSALFYISIGRLWLYITSILILTVADAAAALIGKKYGKIHYKVGRNDVKSLEGSLFFWLVTFQVIQISLLLMTDIPKLSCILSAFLVSSILTGIEAISIKGTDNIFVPVLTCYILLKITTKPVDEIVFQCVSMTGLSVVLSIIIRWVKIFYVRDAIIFIIFTYANWSLGSVDWAIPVLFSFFLYSLIRLAFREKHAPKIETSALMRVLIIPISILFIANATHQYEIWYGSFLLVMQIIFIFSSWDYLLNSFHPRGKKRTAFVILFGLVSGFTITGISALFQEHIPINSFLIMPLISCIMALVYDIFSGNSYSERNSVMWARPIWRISLFMAFVYYLAQWHQLLDFWHPSF